MKLTEHQARVARLAMARGYFDERRACRMDDLAAELGTSRGAVCMVLRRVERAAIEFILADDAARLRARRRQILDELAAVNEALGASPLVRAHEEAPGVPA